MKNIRNKKVDTKIITHTIIDAILDKKGEDLVLMDFRNIKNIVYDYFILCNGTSITHNDTLCRNVEEKVYGKLNVKPSHIEGRLNSEWILLDYLNVIVHIFIKEKRELYNIENLWADANINYINKN